MAEAYTAPIDPPKPDYGRWDPNLSQEENRAAMRAAVERTLQAEREYLEKLAELCRRNGDDPILGEIISFPRGDGYAQYMVWMTKPLRFIWLQIGDAWSVEDALIRGLRLTDVRKMVAAEKRINALFSRKEA